MTKYANQIRKKELFLSIMFLTILIINLSPSLITYAADTSTEIPDDAIHIQSVAQLVAIGGLGSAGKYYVLDNDINLVSEWIPINDFRGTFDGQGYSINNLYILSSSNRQYAGLFGQISASDVTIKNVGVNINSNGVTTTASNARVGGLIGYNTGRVTIENSYTTGEISNTGSSSYTGGLIGSSIGGSVTIKNSYTTSNIVTTAGNAGGLIGYTADSVVTSYLDNNVYREIDGVIIENSYAIGNVSRSVYAGGLIGYSLDSLTIADSYATGNIYGRDGAGGLIGMSRNRVTINNCYATGNITAPGYSSATYAGGLIGYNTGGTVDNSYVTGNVSAPATATLVDGYAGGLTGYGSITVTNCYVTGNILATGYNVYVGGLIGRGGGTIKNSYTTGNITLNAKYRANAGGLSGYIGSATVENSYATGNIVTTSENTACVGGLVGEIGSYDIWGYWYGSANIENSYTTGNITVSTTYSSSGYVGGFIGYIYQNPTIKNSYTTGNITVLTGGSSVAGGLIGYSDHGVATVENSYTIGNITDRSSGGYTTRAGGLIGYSYGGVAIKNCYTKGGISSATTTSTTNNVYSGGLVGHIGINIATVENCYTTGDVSATGRAGSAYAGDLAGFFPSGASVTRCYRLSEQTIIGDPTNYVGAALTPLQMKNQQSFINWNFDTVWAINSQINEGYPYLRGATGTPVVFYDVTVQESRATTTGAGSYKAGDSVTVYAGTWDYYSFSSWSVSGTDLTLPNTATATFTMPEHDVIVTANWSPIPYTITYTLGGGVNAAGNPSSYTVASSFPITINNPTRTNFEFLSWNVTYADSTQAFFQTAYRIPAGTTGNVVLTANWRAVETGGDGGGGSGGGGGSSSSKSSKSESSSENAPSSETHPPVTVAPSSTPPVKTGEGDGFGTVGLIVAVVAIAAVVGVCVLLLTRKRK